MAWVRAKVCNEHGSQLLASDNKTVLEATFNLDRVRFWIGHGHYSELDYGGTKQFILISEAGMITLTNSVAPVG